MPSSSNIVTAERSGVAGDHSSILSLTAHGKCLVDPLQEPLGELSTVKVSLLQLAKVFLFIGVTSFGGGLTAYVRRIIVENKKWMTNAEFFPGVALSQFFPGANVVGIALYVAHHLRGAKGVLVSLSCLLVPPSIFTFVIGYCYFTFHTLPGIESTLRGVAAVACSLMANMFIESARESLKNSMDIVIFLTTFLLIKIGHLSVPCAIMMIAPFAIWCYRPKQIGGVRAGVSGD
jgi:chromate transporter